MSKAKCIQFEETINAPVEKVWEAMFGDETYRRWTAVFTAGSYFDGSWDQGSKIKFLTPDGNGMVAEIAENRPHEHMSIRHLGFVVNGVEDTESDAVRAWAPAYEKYTFSKVPEGTKVVIDQDVTAEYEKMMMQVWPKALDVLKEICEEESDD